MKLKTFMGSGRKIWLFTLPFLIIGVILNILMPSLFDVGGPSATLKVISIIALIFGVAIWIWSVMLVLTRASKKQLITTGPYSIMKHPIYTGVSFLVFPSIGFLFNSWLGAVIGLITYIATRIFAPEEEKKLSKTFGKAWDRYCKKVLIPWL